MPLIFLKMLPRITSLERPFLGGFDYQHRFNRGCRTRAIGQIDPFEMTIRLSERSKN
jgi:hypothetical protein